jgi:hypothetical protein
MTMRDRALYWVERQIRKTRISIGQAEKKPNVSSDEVSGLYERLEVLEWISQLVLGAKEGN